MGQTINEKIHTTLNVKEVSFIVVAILNYIEKIKGKDKELTSDMKKIVNRLGKELYAYPKNDFTEK